MNVNKVFLVGRVANDPKVEMTGQFKRCRISIAVNHESKTKEGIKKETCFIDTTAWGIQADRCGTLLRKGMELYVEGRLRLEKWIDKATGQSREKMVVHPDVITFDELKEQDEGW